MRHFSLKAVAPILISSVVAHTFSREIYSNEPLLQISIGGISNIYEILPLALLGLLAGLIATLYMRGLTGKLPIPKSIPVYLLPIIAGIICGVTGLFLPETLGLGTNFIRNIIESPMSIDYVFFFF